MSTNGYSPLPAASRTLTSGVFDVLAGVRARPHPRYWLHALLLLATLFTTTVVGAGMARSFERGQPFYDLGSYRLWSDGAYLIGGLPFSLTLLGILLAHEMGHYLTARYYNVDATLPFFIPVPTLIGTFGAFIRIRSAIVLRRILFDIGIAGPLAGFAVLILPLIVGVSMSKAPPLVTPGIAAHGELIFGTPPILRFFEWAILHAAPEDVYLHPVARAAWVGLLATALNLLPIGQLDGGHILYAFLGDRTRALSRLFVASLLALGVIQLFTTAYGAGYTWIFWAVVLFFFGLRHPVIIDPAPVSRVRRWLAFAALIILILSFTPTPIRTAGL